MYLLQSLIIFAVVGREQLAVSAAGILIMVAIAWFLDRAAKVPDLFVRVTESGQPAPEAEETTIEGSQVAAH
jgi:hypothetical protein